MILSNLRDERMDGRRRLSMDLVYEDSAVPSGTLYFEAKDSTAEMMSPRADGFAIACLPLAMRHRERRLRVESTLCTRLEDGLRFISGIFHAWYPHCTQVVVEPVEAYAPTCPPAKRRTAMMLSGGIDGMAALRVNRLDYPLDHPESIRECITLFGINNFDHDSRGPVPERLKAFDELLERLRTLGVAEKLEVLPVYTNIRSLAPSYRYWVEMGFGAGHIATVHLFHGHMDKVLYASDGEGFNPSPIAWHPMLVPAFSTNALQVQASELAMTRVEKTALLTDWEYGRRFMQPCHYVRIPEKGRINCGRCEKCVRTMLTLIGLGKLKEVSAFAEDDLPANRLFCMPVNGSAKANLLRAAIPGLIRAGRRDLAWAVRLRLALFHVLRH